jgi:hypothetical protein
MVVISEFRHQGFQKNEEEGDNAPWMRKEQEKQVAG